MSFRTIDDLGHEELHTLVKEHLQAGHMIDRSGMPIVTGYGVEVMAEVAIDEWMGASPIYTKRTQALLQFTAPTVEACFKCLQLDIGAPLEFMDFRLRIESDTKGYFHLDHCGALMDVEPMGEDFVKFMCHDIEDPTFDATAWAVHPHMVMRPIHRPPRFPDDNRHPHCAWTVYIDDENDAQVKPPQLERMELTNAAKLPLTTIEPMDEPDGLLDYSGPLDPDMQPRLFASNVLRALDEEVCLQGHYLSTSFIAAVEDRWGTEAAVDAAEKQLTGCAGVAAMRLKRAYGLGDDVESLATVFDLHPAFRPRSYVDWQVAVEGDTVRLTLGDCLATAETGLETWMTVLADGHDKPLSAIAWEVDPHWSVRADGPRSWVVERSDEAAEELSEVVLTKFSTGAAFDFSR